MKEICNIFIAVCVILVTQHTIRSKAQLQLQFPPLAAYVHCNENVAASFVEQHFVPDLLDYPPYECLFIDYHGYIFIDLGTIVTPTQVKDTPPRLYWRADPNAYYALTMIDPDEITFKPGNIWTVGNIPGNNVSAGDTIVQYLGIGPTRADGYDRFFFTIFQQASGKVQYNEPYISNTNITGRGQFDLKGFAHQHNLYPVAGNYFKAKYDSYTPILYAKLGLNVTFSEQ